MVADHRQTVSGTEDATATPAGTETPQPLLKDVSLVFGLCVALSVPFIAVRWVFSDQDAVVASAYVAIVGVVLAAWGTYAAVRAAPGLRNPWVTMFYLACFAVLLVFYGSAALGLMSAGRV